MRKKLSRFCFFSWWNSFFWFLNLCRYCNKWTGVETPSMLNKYYNLCRIIVATISSCMKCVANCTIIIIGRRYNNSTFNCDILHYITKQGKKIPAVNSICKLKSKKSQKKAKKKARVIVPDYIRLSSIAFLCLFLALPFSLSRLFFLSFNERAH